MNETALYDEPEWYDLLHAEGTEQEAALLEDLFKLHGNGGKRWLEPACGTGRLLAILARRGWAVTGYDINAKAVAYARRRLKHFDRAEVLKSDMRRFRRPKTFDAAFCLLGTFRHLPGDAAALAHLNNTAQSLRKGGIYIVGLDLVDYTQVQDDEETWEVTAGGRRARHAMMCLAPEIRRRRERIVHFVTAQYRGKTRVIECAYDLRSYDRGQWEALIARSDFRIVEAMTHGPQTGAQDALFVLKKI